MYGGFGWKPYVSVAERQLKALRKMDGLRKKGRAISPVSIDGRTIVKTFWGKAWCDNLESYSDFENRLPRGRTYVRNGSVIDLQVAPGQINALVSGSEIYEVEVKILPVAKPRWKSICEDCGDSIDSLVELLQGRLSKGVMERICLQQTGLFPSPKEIRLSCSCPDVAEMCKHVAAVLYGIGARLDQQPELLFRLREVDEKELIVNAGKALPRAKASSSAAKVLGGEDLSKLFGLDIAEVEVTTPTQAPVANNAAATKAKPVVSKAKSDPKGAHTRSTAERVVQAKPALKRKKAAASTKTKPSKAATLKKAAEKTKTKHASIVKRSAAPITRRKTEAATKATPTEKTATKTATAKRST